MGLEQRRHRLRTRKLELIQVVLTAMHPGLECAFQDQPGTRFWRLAGAHMGQGMVIIHDALNQHLDLPARCLCTQQACRNDTGIIKYQQITRPQQVG